MKQPNMRTHNHIRRLIAAALAIIMALSLSVSAFAVEYDTHIDPNCPVCNPGVTQDSKLNAISDALAAVLSFSDVSSTHTFHDAIIWCANQSIVGGYTDGSFKPANTVSRSNFVVMLSRAFYASDIKKYTNDFTLSFGSFYPNYLALKNNGIWNNVGFDTDDIYTSAFAASMNKGISRYDMAQLMTNIMTKKGFSASSSDKNAAINKITDYSSIPSQYRDAVTNVYALGIITGYADGSFNGDGIMNRGQAAVVIYRMMQYTGNSDGNITNPDPETPAEPETPSKPSQPEQTGKNPSGEIAEMVGGENAQEVDVIVEPHRDVPGAELPLQHRHVPPHDLPKGPGPDLQEHALRDPAYDRVVQGRADAVGQDESRHQDRAAQHLLHQPGDAIVHSPPPVGGRQHLQDA